MGEGQQLLVVIASLYLGDCCWWVPRLAWVLGASAGPPRLRFPGGTLGNARGALALQSVLPGVGTSYEIHPGPYTWGRDGLLAWTPVSVAPGGRPPQSVRRVAWDEVKDIDAVGDEVWVNGALFLQARSDHVALAWTREMRALWQSPAVQRESAWRERRQAVASPESLREKARQASRATRSCRWAGAVQFMAMFLVSPLICLRWGLGLGILFSAGLVLVLAVLNSVLYVRAHRSLYPEASGDRIKHALIMCVSFPLSARSADAVLRHCFAGIPAPAVVMSLGDSTASREPLQVWWRDLAHPLAVHELDEAAKRIVDETLVRERLFWSDWIARNGMRAWLETDTRAWSEGDRTECPRCLARFIQSEGECPECPGVRLVPKPGEAHVG